MVWKVSTAFELKRRGHPPIYSFVQSLPPFFSTRKGILLIVKMWINPLPTIHKVLNISIWRLRLCYIRYTMPFGGHIIHCTITKMAVSERKNKITVGSTKAIVFVASWMSVMSYVTWWCFKCVVFFLSLPHFLSHQNHPHRNSTEIQLWRIRSLLKIASHRRQKKTIKT